MDYGFVGAGFNPDLTWGINIVGAIHELPLLRR